MAWVESHQEIGRHPKTKRLARMLGVSLPTAIGHLQLLWWWALDFAPDGSLANFDDGDIADAMLWEGDPNTLVAALMGTGWIDSDRAIHDWYDYAGKLVERRRMEAERLRNYRKSNKHVQHTSDQRTPYERSTLVVTVPDSTLPDLVPEGVVGGSGGNDGSEPVGADAPPEPKPTARTSKGRRSAPESLTPNEIDLRAGADLGFGPEIVGLKAAAMLDHFRAKGEHRADWHATLRTWLRNAPKFDPLPEPITNGHAMLEAPCVKGVGAKLRPATDDDLEVWSRARSSLAATMNAANFDGSIAPLTVAGRGVDGGLRLLVNPLVVPHLAGFRHHISRALEDAGDSKPMAVAFVARRSPQETHHAE